MMNNTYLVRKVAIFIDKFSRVKYYLDLDLS